MTKHSLKLKETIITHKMCEKHKKTFSILSKFSVQTSFTEVEVNLLRVNDLQTDGHSEL